jgi:hypothetical protein
MFTAAHRSAHPDTSAPVVSEAELYGDHAATGDQQK